ncbi:MAG TPA: DNA-formamidopyrimidine glycosylase family protein [Burkholderiales bacterium]
MPELPDVEVYVGSLRERIAGRKLLRVRLASPFVLRTALPPLSSAEGRRVAGVRRIGKRIAIALEDGPWLVLHLMIAGRLRWLEPGEKPPGRITLALFDLENGTLAFTEAGTKRRASLHVVASLEGVDPGGAELAELDTERFKALLTRENRTLKRALTDPRVFSGIGNAYSDEILHRARLSPIAMTQKLAEGEIERLFRAARDTLQEWTERLRREAAGGFPGKVTAFRDGMAVHGRFGKPCPACGSPVQRIVFAENETNYCARCQTGGRILADRALSRLLKKSWPRTLEELE